MCYGLDVVVAVGRNSVVDVVVVVVDAVIVGVVADELELLLVLNMQLVVVAELDVVHIDVQLVIVHSFVLVLVVME